MVTVLDSFEDGDISEYSGDTGEFSVGTSNVYDGSYALTSDNTGKAITRTDLTISPSETPFGAWLRPNSYYISVIDDNTAIGPRFLFGVESATGFDNLVGYSFRIESTKNTENTNGIYIEKFDGSGGGPTELASSACTITAETYYEAVITEWTAGGNITAEIRDTNGNTVSGSQVSVTDDTYGSGGFGWGITSGDGEAFAYYDYAYKPTAITAPTNVHFNDTTTEDELTLDWDEVSSANGYYVYRAQSSGSTTSDYTQVADVTSPPYTDTGLEDGEQYYYRVSSHD